MFTTTMTDSEVLNAAYTDYKEMRVRVQLAFEQFRRNLYLKRGQTRSIHSVIETKKFRTKARNEWNIIFLMNSFSNVTSRIFATCLVYVALPRANGTDYIFINFNYEKFTIEWITAHFIMRYKERYLDYKKIDTQGKLPVVYYMLHNQDRTQTYYHPENWTDADMKDRQFLISKQGLSVLRVTNNGQLLQYVTFLDQENLSRYKSIVYEEQQLFKLIMEISALYREEIKTNNTLLMLNRRSAYKKLRETKNVDKLIEGFVHRLLPAKPEEWPRFIENFHQVYDYLIQMSNELEENWDKVLKEVQPKSLYDRSVRLSPKELFNNYWAELNEHGLLPDY